MIDISRKEIDEMIKGLKANITIKLGRYGRNVFLVDTKGRILIRKLDEEDFRYLVKYLKNDKN